MEENIKKKPACEFRFFVDAEQLKFINQIIYFKLNEGHFSYTLKSCFLEGLELLKIKYPNVPERIFKERRQYRGGKQSRREVYKSGIRSTPEINDWIEDFIVMKLKEDFYYSKNSFIEELLTELKTKYDGKLLELPNQTQNENKSL